MSSINHIDMNDYNRDMLLDLLDKITVDEINNDYLLASDSVKYTLYNPSLYLTGASIIIQFEVSNTRDSMVWLRMFGDDRIPYQLIEISDVILHKLIDVVPQLNTYSQYALADFKSKLKFELIDRMSDGIKI